MKSKIHFLLIVYFPIIVITGLITFCVASTTHYGPLIENVFLFFLLFQLICAILSFYSALFLWSGISVSFVYYIISAMYWIHYLWSINMGTATANVVLLISVLFLIVFGVISIKKYNFDSSLSRLQKKIVKSSRKSFIGLNGIRLNLKLELKEFRCKSKGNAKQSRLSSLSSMIQYPLILIIVGLAASLRVGGIVSTSQSQVTQNDFVASLFLIGFMFYFVKALVYLISIFVLWIRLEHEIDQPITLKPYAHSK